MFSLASYLSAFNTIDGWFSFDAAILFALYNDVLRESIDPANTLEIGVHHGLSAIAVAGLRGEGCGFTAIDLFEGLQEKNRSRSGDGNRAIFEDNLRRFYPDADAFLNAIAAPSAEQTPATLGANYTFCNVDGGHSREETRDDLQLCFEILKPGGIVALDDYFNPLFPGVAEGAVEFFLRDRTALRPLAIGYNKVLFQKAGVADSLNSRLLERFATLKPAATVTLWDAPALLFSDALHRHFDLDRSTFRELVPLHDGGTRARITVTPASLQVACGSECAVEVTVENTSRQPLPHGESVFAISYHVLAPNGKTLVHDNDRSWIEAPLDPGSVLTRVITLRAPQLPGRYLLEFDLVWEGVMWLREAGNEVAYVELGVTAE